MHKQGHGKSVRDILMSNVMAEILLIFTCLYTSRYEDRGRDPTSKGPLTGVKLNVNKETLIHARAFLPIFFRSCESNSL